MQGQVKWFSSEKGYGFISCEEVENDIYVHFSDIQMKGYRTLEENDFVEFEYDEEMKKAVNVLKVSAPENTEEFNDAE
ncbi:MAG: cold shock domain-containing protein [Clostridiales bacterium]|nr:cold shock domain-containing protein [Clostridiales bacterium]